METYAREQERIRKQREAEAMSSLYSPTYTGYRDDNSSSMPAEQQGGMGQLAGAAGDAATAYALMGGGSAAAAPAITGAGSAVGSTLTIGAGQAVPAGYTAIGSAAGGGTIVAPSSVAGGSSALGTAASYALPLAGAVGLFDLYDNERKGARGALQGAASGAALGSLGGPVGAAIGGGIGLVGGLTSKFFGSGKSGDQKERDAIREKLEGIGVAKEIEGSHHVTLADGTTFEIGKDGGARLVNAAGEKRHYANVDFSDPNAVGAIRYADPLGAIFTDGDKRRRSDIAGYLVNAATSNASDPEAIKNNLRAIVQNSGLDRTSAVSTLQSLKQQGKIDQSQLDAWSQGISELFPEVAPQSPAGDSRPRGRSDSRLNELFLDDRLPIASPTLDQIVPKMTVPRAPIEPTRPMSDPGTEFRASNPQYQKLLSKRAAEAARR